MGDTSIINEDIQTFKSLRSYLDKILDGILLGQLGNDNLRLSARFRYFVSGFFQLSN